MQGALHNAYIEQLDSSIYKIELYMYNTELSIIAQYYIRCYLDASVYKTELSWYQLFSEGEEQNQAFHM